MLNVSRVKRFWRQYRNKIKAKLGVGNAEILQRGNLPPYFPQNPRMLSVPQNSSCFKSSDVLHGTFCTPECAADIPCSLWVEIEGASECIRYYPAGLNPIENQKVMIYFPGDLLLRTSRGERLIVPGYKKKSPDTIMSMMRGWSEDAETPAIFLARPGTYGSSGNHEKSRQTTEVQLVYQAISMLKDRYNINCFILVGHSGGGQMAAAMLNLRKDIHAAIMTSGLLSVHLLAKRFRKIRRTPGVKKIAADVLYDPIKHLHDIPDNPQPIIMVISDPRDLAVPFYSQVMYVKELKSQGLTVHHIYAHAPEPKYHALALHGQKSASLIAKGVSINGIRAALVSEDLANIS